MNELHALLGFVAGLFGVLLIERTKETRKRLRSVRAVEWQLNALIEACEWAVESKAWDSSKVECIATFITRAFQAQPEIVIAPRSERIREALWNTYAEASGILALIELHRAQVKDNLPCTALNDANYKGVIQRSRETLALLKTLADCCRLPVNNSFKPRPHVPAKRQVPFHLC